MSLRKPTPENPVKVGEFVLRASMLFHGIVSRPKKVIRVSGGMITAEELEACYPGESRMKITSVRYVTPNLREAQRAFAVSERYRKYVEDGRRAAVSDIEAIESEPVV